MKIEVINNVHFNVEALNGLTFEDFKTQFGRILGIKTLETWNKLAPFIREEPKEDQGGNIVLFNEEPEKISLDQIARENKEEFFPSEKPKKKKKKFL